MTNTSQPNRKIKNFFAIIGTLLFCLFAFRFPVCAQTDEITDTSLLASSERILDWQSDIIINEDTSLTVTETIKVNALNYEINHGIYRDYPTEYRSSLGFVDSVGFTIVSVTYDSTPVPYSIEAQQNGVRVYIGDPNLTVPLGEHTYVLVYNTTEQLGFFNNYDELYFNVTGNGWVFPFDVARATVRLPSGVREEMVRVGGYTGLSGSKDEFLTTSVETVNGFVYASFETMYGLGSYEGLTVFVNWPKGFVPEPGFSAKAQDFARDNSPAIVGFAGATVLLVYYLAVWYFFGRDPSGSAVYPRFELSRALSPARARLLKKMTLDTKGMTAALVTLAVKGYVRIVQNKVLFSNLFSVEKVKEFGVDLATEEEGVLMNNLFAGRDSFSFTNSRYQEVQGVTKAFNAIMKDFSKGKLRSNIAYIFGGVVIALAGLSAVIITGAIVHGEKHIISLIPISIFMGFSVFIVGLIVSSIIKNKMANVVGCLVQFGCVIPFILIFLGVTIVATKDMLDKSISVYELVFCMFFIAVHFIFVNAMKVRTLEGRRLYEEVAGLEMFIRATEEEKLKLVGTKLPLTFSTYENFLPYAIALDLEQLWASQFAKQIEEAMAASDTHPMWYVGNSFSSSGFTSNLSSAMSSSIASSSAPPGSSGGGGGGGGGSGGGGGGGGGGGW